MEYFREFPEVDCLQMFLWENDFTSDSNQVFPQLYWRAPKRNHLKGDSVYKRDNLCLSQPYFSNVDILTDVLSAYAKGAQKAGKLFSVLTFSHYPWHEAMLIEALKRMDSSIPIHLDHKCQPGDWDLFRPTNNVLEHLNQKPNASMLFDGAGEYWGQCRIPFCMPEEVQFRLQHALNYNENLSEIGMRVMWHYDAVFDNYNEVNLYALSRLVKDPWLPIEQVWDEWAVKRFGAEAAPLMESALKRTFEIAKRNFYILGCWSGNHSLLPSLEYTVAHVMNFGRANYEWNPMDFHFGGVYRELRDRPREYTIQRVLKEKDEALAMAEASMEDIRKVAPLLSDEERERAFYQFGLLLDYTRIVKDHNEAYIRYWVEKTNPSEAAAGNREKLLAALDRMAEAVPMVEQKYADTEPLLKAEHLINYIAEVKAALAELPQQA